jgi:undecaprenyl pyrophosphate phosphatase UppP
MHMQKRNRTQLVLGILLILVAAWLIATRINPALAKLIQLPAFDWPMWVIIAGAVLLVIGLLTGAPGMAVPACIVAGIGCILFYQKANNDWGSWSYMWTLIPGFVGLGSILAGLLGDNFKKSIRDGLNSLLVSAVLFAVFGTFFHAWGIFGEYSNYVPVAALFLAGIWLIVRGFLRRK